MVQDGSAKKILLVTQVSFFDVDKLCSLLILGKLIARQYNVVPDIYIPGIPNLNLLSELVAPTSINFLEKLTGDYLTISLQKDNARVKNVKWEETPSHVNVMIYTEKGEINKEYAVNPGKPHYDLLFVLGINNRDKLTKTIGEFASVIDSSESYNIDLQSGNQKYLDHNFIYSDAKTFGQTILSFAKENELEIKPEEATELLTCIYWRTNALRNRQSTQNTFENVLELLNLGANIEKASDKVYRSISPIERKARQEIFANIKIDENNLAFSSISQATANQLKVTNPINPIKNPLFDLKDVKASFVLLPLDAERTLVLASNHKRLSMRSIFKKENYVGDDLQGEFTVAKNVSTTEEHIRNAIRESDAKPSKKEKEPVSQPLKQENKLPEKVKEDAEIKHEEITQALFSTKPQTTAASFVAPKPEPINADPLAPAIEKITPEPAPASAVPAPLFGQNTSGGGGQNPDSNTSSFLGPK